MKLYIGIDIGTSGCRAIAIDPSGEIKARHQAGLAAPEHHDGQIEQHPELWWQACRDVLHRLLEQLPRENVQAIAIDGTSGTLLLADHVGTPLAPALMYNDASSQQQARQITEVAPPNSAAHGASSGLAKLINLIEQHQPEKGFYALPQASWLAGRLSGVFDVSDENNCLKLGYNSVEQCWPDWLATLNIPLSCLPKVIEPGQVIDKISAATQQCFGLPASTVVVAGTTDSIAAAIATGIAEPGDAMTSLGSTLAIKIISEQPVFAPEQGIYSHRLFGRWLAGGASNSGGNVLLHYFDRHQLDRMTPLLRPDSPTGLDYYPLVTTGERFPFNDPAYPPQLEPRPADDVVFFQALLEGIARIEYLGYQTLKTFGAPWPTSIRTVGGGAVNQSWSRIREQLMHVPMGTPAHSEAAYGAALLAKNNI